MLKAWTELAALLIMGVIAGGLMFLPVPNSNVELLTFVLGTLGGALTVSGGRRRWPL